MRKVKKKKNEKKKRKNWVKKMRKRKEIFDSLFRRQGSKIFFLRFLIFKGTWPMTLWLKIHHAIFYFTKKKKRMREKFAANFGVARARAFTFWSRFSFRGVWNAYKELHEKVPDKYKERNRERRAREKKKGSVEEAGVIGGQKPPSAPNMKMFQLLLFPILR